MFLALIYLVILVVWAIFGISWSDSVGRRNGVAQFILFAIIGFVLFFKELNR